MRRATGGSENRPAKGGSPRAGAPALPPRRRLAASPYHRELGVAVLLGILLAGVGALRPGFLAVGNLRDMLVNSVTPAIAAAGMTAVIVAAEIDISIGSLLAVCAVVAAELAKAGWPTAAALGGALAAGGLLGAVNGALTAYAEIPSIIVTLGTMGVLRGLVTWITGGSWIRDLPPGFSAWTDRSVAGLPAPVWLAAMVAVATGAGMARMRWGRWVYAAGSQRRATRLSGVPVRAVTLGVFVLQGLLVGLAAFVFASRFSLVQSNAGRGFELEVITGVVVGGTDIFGGRGTVLGSMLGVLLITTVETALAFLRIAPEWVPAVQGGLILVAVLGDALRRR